MSISIPQLPKGTRDFYPEAERIQNYIFDTWRSVAESFAYEEYEGPMFEHLELYTGKSGEEIVSQLYNFKDKGDREIALRPEMTPTLARLVIQKARELKKPFKWFSMPRLFRYEKAQKGRLREFFQLNMDIQGSVEETGSGAAAAVFLQRLDAGVDDSFVSGKSGVCVGTEHHNLVTVHGHLGSLFAGYLAEIRIDILFHHLLGKIIFGQSGV